MKRVLLFVCLSLAAGAALSDTQVKGHYRKDGTYVQPHARSSPNSTRNDNYGQPSSSQKRENRTYGTAYPSTRDQDRDGAANTYDYDDNNNGVVDDYEPRK